MIVDQARVVIVEEKSSYLGSALKVEATEFADRLSVWDSKRVPQREGSLLHHPYIQMRELHS